MARWIASIFIILALGVGANASAKPEAQGGHPLPTADDAGKELKNEAVLEAIDPELLKILSTPIEVWTATKTRSTLDEAPAVITVISRVDIERWSFDSLDQMLRHVVGFYLVDDHIIPNVGVRGIPGGLAGESGNIKLMIDGHSVAFRSTSGNWLGAELIPISAIERVEIIRGPASALYGADAFLGIINVITRKGGELKGGDVKAQGNMGDNKELGGGIDLSVGSRVGPVDVLVAARIHHEDRSGLKIPSSSPAPAIPGYSSRDNAASHLELGSKVGLAKIDYHLSSRHTFSLAGYLSVLDRGAEFSQWAPLSYGTSDDGVFNFTRISLYLGHVSLTTQSKFTERFSLDGSLRFSFGGPLDDDRIEVGSPLYYIKRDFGYEAVDLTVEGRVKILQSMTTLIGAEYNHDRESLPSVLYVLKIASKTNEPGAVLESASRRQGTESLQNVGAYAQLLWRPFEKYLHLTGGLRFDYHNIFGDHLSGRVALVSNPLDSLYIKLLYNSAFKAPSPLLLYATPFSAGDIIGNPALDSQYIHSFEGHISYKWRFLTASTGLSYNLLLNKAEFIQQRVNRAAQNLAQVESLSWETELQASYQDWVWGYLSAEIQYARRDLGLVGYQAELYGWQNVIYPPYIFRAGIAGRFPKIPMRGSTTGVLVGPRRSSDMNSLENFGSYELDPYFLWDVVLSTAGLDLLEKRRTTVSLKLRNILGTHGPDPGFTGIDYPLAARTVLLDLRQEL